MLTSVWGPSLWHSLHTISFNYPVKPTKELFDADPIGYMKQNLEYEEQKAQYDAQMAQLQQVSQKSSEAEANAKQFGCG